MKPRPSCFDLIVFEASVLFHASPADVVSRSRRVCVTDARAASVLVLIQRARAVPADIEQWFGRAPGWVAQVQRAASKLESTDLQFVQRLAALRAKFPGPLTTA